MSSHGSGSNAYRARSRSPPSRQYQERDKVVSRINRHDPDAPPKSLPRKPGTSANAIPVGPVSGHSSSSYAVASSSSSALDRNATGQRFISSTSTDPSASRTSSAVIKTPADLVGRLYASPPERQLFDQIEQLRSSVEEQRRGLTTQLARLKSTAALIEKAGPTSSSTKAYTDHQNAVNKLEQRIKTDTDELYRKQIQWQIDVNAQIVPSLLAAVIGPLEAKLGDLKSERERDCKRQAEFESTAKSYHGQIKKCLSDCQKLSSDLSSVIKDNGRLRQELAETRKSLRDDVDKDVVQINANREEIKRLKRKFDEGSSTGHPIAAGGFVRTPSVAPPSPRPAAPTTASPALSHAAVAREAPMEDDPQAHIAAVDSKAMTQAQFRKWKQDHDKDLELRLDEVKDLAVQEASAENQACMEARLRALARKWRSKALAEGDLSSAEAPAAPSANVNDFSSNAAPPTDAARPMDVDDTTQIDTDVQHNGQINARLGTNGGETLPNVGVTTGMNGSAAPTGSQPELAIPEAAPTPSAALQIPSTAVGTISDGVAPTKSNPTTTDQPALTTPPLPGVSSPAQSQTTEKIDTAEQPATVPQAALDLIHVALNGHETQLAAVKQEIDALRSSEIVSALDRWVSTPDKVKRLLDQLKSNGLSRLYDDLREAVARTQMVTTQTRFEVDALRVSQEGLRNDLVESMRTLKTEVNAEMVVTVDAKLSLQQNQIKELHSQVLMLDDQSSLQGALLVKLAEHANPRRNPPPAAVTMSGGIRGSAGPQSPGIRPPIVQRTPSSARILAPAPRPEQQLQRPHQQALSVLSNQGTRPQQSLNTAPPATALSPHTQPPLHPPQQPAQPAQVHRLAPQTLQETQQQQRSEHAVRHNVYQQQNPAHPQGP